MHMDRESQLLWKRARVEDAFRHIGGLSPAVAPVETDGQAFGYRNKIQMPVSMGPEGIVAGFFAPRSHRIVPCGGCLLQSEKTKAVIKATVAWMEEWGIAPYREEDHKGQVRHIFVREGTQGDLMVSLITRTGAALPGLDALIKTLIS